MKSRQGEHPFNHPGQLIFLVLFLAFWIGDSFVLRLTLFNSTPFFMIIRWIVLILCFSLSFYLMKSGHRVFDNEKYENTLITDGAFRFVRHPIYSGILLIYLGLSLFTGSLISLVLTGVIFLFYNYIAGYEESYLKKRFGRRYEAYKEKTAKWIPNR